MCIALGKAGWHALIMGVDSGLALATGIDNTLAGNRLPRAFNSPVLS